jgi:hypothetical protein
MLIKHHKLVCNRIFATPIRNLYEKGTGLGKDNKHPILEDPILDTGKLKKVFDQITEVDNDPTSEKSQKYYKSLEEQTR